MRMGMLRERSRWAKWPESMVEKRVAGMKVPSVVARNSCRERVEAAVRRWEAGRERRRESFWEVERERGMEREVRRLVNWVGALERGLGCIPGELENMIQRRIMWWDGRGWKRSWASWWKAEWAPGSRSIEGLHSSVRRTDSLEIV